MYLVDPSGLLKGTANRTGGYTLQPLASGDIRGLLVQDDGIYFSRNLDLWHLQGGKIEAVGARTGLPPDDWAAIARDSLGNLWVRSTTKLFELPAGLTHFIDRSRRVPHAIDPRLTADARGRLYVSTLTGVVIFDGLRSSVLDGRHGLPGETVSPMLLDRNDTLWLGMAGAGLVRRLGHGEWSSWRKENGLVHNSVWAIHRDSEGKIWVGTSAGLTLLNSSGTAVRSWSTLTGLAADRVLAIAELPSGDVLVGTDPFGIAQFSASGRLVRTYGENQSPLGRISAMSLDHHGSLWVLAGKGVFRAEAVSKAGAYLRFQPMILPDLHAATTFRDIAVTEDGVIWIASSQGLLRYADGRWRQFTTRDGLAAMDLASVKERNGVVWIAYRDALGMTRFTFDGKHLDSHPVTTADGLSSDEIYALAFDHEGRLWASNDRGVDRLTDGHWQHFGVEDGLVWDDTNGRALEVDQNGDVWIGTSGGMSRYTSPAFLNEPQSLTPALTAIHSDGSEWQPDQSPSLPYASRNLSFQFAALGATGDRTRFRYRVLGYDSEWIETAQRTIEIAALPAGHYLFEVTAQESTGAWSAPTAHFSFTILPPWWQRWYVLGILLCFAILAARVVWRLRVQALIGQKNRLQDIIDLQTAELRERHQQLEAIAYVDQLTSLPNRRWFTQELRRRIDTARADHKEFVLLLMDLDRFKHVNDHYGHDAGDVVLRTVGDRLRSILRNDDSVARLGGDEFVMLVGSNVEPAAVELLCSRIADSCSAPIAFQETELRVGCSIGIAVFPRDGETEDSLCKAADLAMYEVKRQAHIPFRWFHKTEANLVRSEASRV
jgi:diguanylate cyclase (GGDEF)-like protein